MTMLPVERRARLVQIVRASGVRSTEDLAAALNVSAETVRRDMLHLEKQGAISRVHGGATTRLQSAVASEPPFALRSGEKLGRKRSIAKLVADLVPSGSMVMIDIGTTALLAARALPDSLSATIVTTSLHVAMELSDSPGLQVLVAGGKLRAGDLALSGPTTSLSLAGMHFDVALLGSGGLHHRAGLTDYYLEEAEARRSIIKNSARSYVLCDATKFGKVAPFQVASLSDFSGVIVDETPDEELSDALLQAGTEIISSS